MRRKKQPLDGMDEEDQAAKAKVSVVLEVLAGETTIAEACRQAGVKPIHYYKLEERMVRAMVATAKLKPGRGRRKDPLAEATNLASETEALRQEHRRMQSLLRISKKLLRSGTRKPRKTPLGRPPKVAPTAEGSPIPTEPRRPGRPPLAATTT